MNPIIPYLDLFDNYAKYDIKCHMVFYAAMVTSRMKLLMNKLTDVVMGDG